MNITPKSLASLKEDEFLPGANSDDDFRIKMFFGNPYRRPYGITVYGLRTKLPNTGKDGLTTVEAAQLLGKQVENTFLMHFGLPPVEVEGEWLPKSYVDAERAGGRTMLSFLTPEEARVIAKLRSESETD